MKHINWLGFVTSIFLLAPSCLQAFGDMGNVRGVCEKLPPRTVLFVMTDNIGQAVSDVEASSIGTILSRAGFDEVYSIADKFADEFNRNASLADDSSIWETIKKSNAQCWLALVEVDSNLETVIAIAQREPLKLEKTILDGLGWEFDSEIFQDVHIRKLQFSNACAFSLKHYLYISSSVELSKDLIKLNNESGAETLAKTRKFQRCAGLQQNEFDVWCYCDPTVIARVSRRNLRENPAAFDDKFMASNLGEILAVFGSLTFADSREARAESLLAEIHMLLALPNRRLARLLAFKETGELKDAFVVPANCDAVARISFDIPELLRGAEETVDSSNESNTYRSQFVEPYEQTFGVDIEEFSTRQLTGDVALYYRQTELNRFMGIPFDIAFQIGDEKEARKFLDKLCTSDMTRESREMMDVQGVPVWKDKDEVVERRKEGMRRLLNQSGDGERDVPVPEVVLAVFNRRIYNCFSIEDMKAHVDAWQEKKGIEIDNGDWRRVDQAITRLAGNESVSTRIYFRNGVQYKYFYEYLKSGNAVSAFIDYSYPPKVVKRFTDLQQKLRHLPDSKDLLQDIPAAGAFISGNPRDGHIAFTFFELNAVDKR